MEEKRIYYNCSYAHPDTGSIKYIVDEMISYEKMKSIMQDILDGNLTTIMSVSFSVYSLDK